jgi:hypothetical protein
MQRSWAGLACRRQQNNWWPKTAFTNQTIHCTSSAICERRLSPSLGAIRTEALESRFRIRCSVKSDPESAECRQALRWTSARTDVRGLAKLASFCVKIRSLNDASHNTYDLMTQPPKYGLCCFRINPHRCLRTSSENHAAGEREVRIFKGFRCPLNFLAPRAPLAQPLGRVSPVERGRE